MVLSLVIFDRALTKLFIFFTCAITLFAIINCELCILNFFTVSRLKNLFIDLIFFFIAILCATIEGSIPKHLNFFFTKFSINTPSL